MTVSPEAKAREKLARFRCANSARCYWAVDEARLLLGMILGIGIARDLEASDLHVEVIDVLGNRVEAEVGVVFCGGLIQHCGKRPSVQRC